MTDQPDLRQQVRAALKESGYSQAEIARHLGLSTKHMSQMLTGKTTMSWERAHQIAEACGSRLTVTATPSRPPADHANKADENPRRDLRDRMARALFKSWSVPDGYQDVARREAKEEAEVCATAVQPELDAGRLLYEGACTEAWTQRERAEAAERQAETLLARCAVLESIARDAVEYRCPRCARWAPWTDGRSISAGDDADEFWCQTCGAETPLSGCDRRSVVELLTKRAESAEAETARLGQVCEELKRETAGIAVAHDQLRDRVLAYSDQLDGFCSPHGVSAVYAEQLRDVVRGGGEV